MSDSLLSKLAVPVYSATFEKWWNETQASKYGDVTGAMQQAFKSIAHDGWKAAKILALVIVAQELGK